jgi:hypothetical protein
VPVFPLRFRCRRSLLEHPIPAGGIGPPSRLGYRTEVPVRTPTVVTTLRTIETRPGWVPPPPRDGGVRTADRSATAATRRFPAASPTPPAPHSISGVICDEALNGGLASFTRPVISLACSPRMARAPLDVNPDASNPTVTGDARQGGNRPLDTGPELHRRHTSTLQSASPLASCDLVVASPRRSRRDSRPSPGSSHLIGQYQRAHAQ